LLSVRWRTQRHELGNFVDLVRNEHQMAIGEAHAGQAKIDAVFATGRRQNASGRGG